jgi:hypothetical protein
MTMPAPRVAPLGADCVADSAGGLTFDVTASGASGVAYLVLRRRGGSPRSSLFESGGGEEEIGLPLTPAADGRLRAALPSTVALPEGRWDAYVRVAGREPQRLAPGATDLSSLAARTPSGSRGHVAVRIPYGTRQGNLTVRSWLRAPHAEADELRLDSAGLTVQGRVYGTGLAPDAYAELRDRQRLDPARRTEVAVDRTEFALSVAYACLRPGIWDLWLRPGGEAGPRVRVARLLDDVADKKPVFTYPRARVQTPDGPVEAGPYYTRDKDTSLSRV